MELKIKDDIIYCLEAEQYVIAAILGNNKNYDEVSSFLKPKHFSDSLYEKVYETTSKIINENGTADFFIVSDKLKLDDKNKDLLKEISIKGIGLNNTKDYAMILLNRYNRRCIINAVENSIYQIEEDPSFDIIEEVGTSFDEITNIEDDDYGIDVFEEIENRVKNKGKLLGFPTGISALNNAMDGWEKGSLYTLGGRSGMGKSALMSYFAKYLLERNIKVGMFSLEMKKNQLKQRILSSLTKIDTKDMRKGNITADDFEKLISHKMIFNKLLISDKSGVNINYIKSKARSWKRKGCDIIFIDHLLLIKSMSSKGDTQAQRIGKITSALKVMAKELDIAIILLAQLNRESEKRENHRPQLSDLKDSGSIEEDSDGVIFIYNPCKYLMNNKPEPKSEKFLEWQKAMDEKKNKGEIIVAKNRHGEECIIDIYMDIPTMTFSDLYKEVEGEEF